MTPIIYTYGGGQYLNSLFESLSILFDFSQNDTLIWLFRIAALLGLIIIVLQTFAQRSANGAAASIDWIYFVRFFLIWFVFIVPRSDVEIQDITTKATYKVSNAPWSLSIIGWFTSNFGMGLVNVYEAILGGGMNPVEQFSGNGLGFGSSYYNVLPKVARFDSKTMSFVTPFISECLIPAVGPLNSKWSGITKTDLFSTPDYEGAISRMNANFLKNRYVYVEDKSVTCYDLREQLKSSIVPNGDRVLNNLGISKWQVVNDLDHDFISQATTQSANSLRQAMMINAIQATAITMAVSNNDPSLADALTSAQTQQQQITAWRQGSQFASVSMVWLHVVAECMIYALFPLLCFLFLLPVGWNVLFDYIKVMFWIQMWPIMYAILNSIIAIYATSKSQALAQAYSGVSLDNFYQISDLNGGVVAAAGYISTLIPVLSWMLMQKGTSSLANIAGGFQGSINSTAETAGKQETLGSMDINRVSVKNTDTAGQTRDGLQTDTHVGTTGSTTNVGGYETIQSRAMDNKIITSVDYAKTAQSQISNMVQSVHQRAGQEAQQWQKMSQSFHNAAINNSGGHGSSSGTGGGDKATYDQASQLAADLGIKAEAMAKVGASFFGSEASIGVRAQGSMQSKAAQDYKQALGKYTDFANKHNISTDNVVGDGFKSAEGLAQNSSKTISDALNISRAQTTLNSMGDTVKVNGDNAFVQDLMAQGMTGEQINDMQAHNPGQFNQLAQKFAEEKFVPQILGDTTNYSVQGVDVAGTDKAITGHAGRYANDGNVDHYTNKAQTGIDSENQQIKTDAKAVSTKHANQADKFNNHKGKVVVENLKDTAKNVPGAKTVARKVEQTYNKTEEINRGIEKNLANDTAAVKQYNDEVMKTIREQNANELSQLEKIKPPSVDNPSDMKENLTNK